MFLLILQHKHWNSQSWTGQQGPFWVEMTCSHACMGFLQALRRLCMVQKHVSNVYYASFPLSSLDRTSSPLAGLGSFHCLFKAHAGCVDRWRCPCNFVPDNKRKWMDRATNKQTYTLTVNVRHIWTVCVEWHLLPFIIGPLQKG